MEALQFYKSLERKGIKSLPNILLLGNDLEAKEEFIYSLSSLFFFQEITKKERVINHPDFILLKKEENEKIIKKERVDQCIKRLEISAISAEKKILYIEELSDITLESSNALLKTIEEENVIVLASSKTRPISTICSRMLQLRFYRKEVVTNHTFNQFQDIERILEEQPEKLLEVLHFLKEKDSNNIYSQGKILDLITYLEKYIGNILKGTKKTSLSQDTIEELLYLIQREQEETTRKGSNYNFNDAFLFIAEIISSCRKSRK